MGGRVEGRREEGKGGCKGGREEREGGRMYIHVWSMQELTQQSLLPELPRPGSVQFSWHHPQSVV